MKKVVVIGGNGAGMSAASQIKRLKPQWRVVVLERGRHISYASCGIPYYIEGIVPSLEQLVALTPQQAVDDRGIELRLNREVTAVSAAEKIISVSGTAGAATETYDYLVIATGSIPSTEGIEVSSERMVFSIKNLDDAETVQTFIKEHRPRTAAVIGGGYIALEMLEAIQNRGIETHLIHRRSHLTRSLEPAISELITKKLAREGVHLHLNTAVESIIENNKKVAVHTPSGELLFDCVILALGVKPNTEFLKDTSIALGIKNAIRVNRYMQTSVDNIYAAGDCAETFHLVTEKPVYVPLALKANKEGVVAGVNICGGQEEFPGIAGTAITKIFDLGVARTGLSLNEARENGFDPVQVKVASHSKAGYYPGNGRLTSILTIDQNQGRLLGAQLAGPLDGVKRIDVYTTALASKMTLEQIYNLDLSYAPPFSPVFDPVLLAARVGKKMVRYKS